MSWWLIEAGMAGADPEVVAHALAEVTGQAVEERAGSVLGYVADESAAAAAAGAIAERFGTSVVLATSPVDPADWTVRWREGLGIRSVGRLRLGPSWLLEPGADTVVIDPETAFGSGEHGSTRGRSSCSTSGSSRADRCSISEAGAAFWPSRPPNSAPGRR